MEIKSLKAAYQRWGGSVATFFTYTHLSHDSLTGLLPAMLPLIRETLGLSYLQSGLLLSAFTVTTGISQLPGGWLGDRISRHKVIAIGLGGVSLSAFAVGLNSSYYPIFFLLVIMGIFAGAYHPSAVTLLSSQFDETRRGKVIAVHMVGGSIGFAIGPIIGGLIGETLGWRWSFVLLSLPVIAAVPIVLNRFRQQDQKNSLLKNGASHPAREIPGPPFRKTTVGQVLRPLALITILTVSSQFLSGAVMAFLPIYIVDKHQVAPESAVFMMGLIRAGGIVGSLFGGWMSDGWGRKNAVYLVLVTTGIVMYVLTQLPFSVIAVIVFVLFGLLQVMRQAVFQPFLMDNVPPHLSATIFGIYFGLGMEGISLLQPVAGHFMDIYGIEAVFYVIALISVALSLVTLLVAVLPRWQRERARL